MKKLINKPEDVVKEELEGISMAYPDMIKVHFDPNFIYRVDAPVKDKVSLISGGGSGHEPMHGSFVGLGMLDAACPGDIFTSPTPDQMLEATKMVATDKGVLYIIKNYSGDVMNFKMAADMAHDASIKVDIIIIDDDAAVKDSLFTEGRRGVGTTIIAEHILGAAAEEGYNLKELVNLGRRVNINGRSMGMALTSCTAPMHGKPTFELGPDEIEIGIGIHGEPGRKRMNLKTADEITELLALSIIEDDPYTRTITQWDGEKKGWVDIEVTDPPFKEGDEVLAFVNSMGGTPDIELLIIYRKLYEICKEKGIKIVRNLIGRYITSLEMQGCSITLVKMDNEMIKLWDAPVKTTGIRWGI